MPQSAARGEDETKSRLPPRLEALSPPRYEKKPFGSIDPNGFFHSSPPGGYFSDRRAFGYSRSDIVLRSSVLRLNIVLEGIRTDEAAAPCSDAGY